MKSLTILLPPKWINCLDFQGALSSSNYFHRSVKEVIFQVPERCKIMVDAGVILLSFANQLNFFGKKVILQFEEDEYGALGYLNRMGFFDFLNDKIDVFPERPFYSGAKVYGGKNPGLVEIKSINPNSRDENLPSTLADTLKEAIVERPDCQLLRNAAFTVFGELIDNIFEHSSTELDGYAALQVYKGGSKIKVIVSDSGKGILQTLRPSLSVEFPSLSKLSDTELLLEVFRRGVSRHGTNRGCGLKQSAEKALKYKANLTIRLPNSCLCLEPSSGTYRSTAYCYESLPKIHGTQINFDFFLDRQK